jgi:hypothetical protein
MQEKRTIRENYHHKSQKQEKIGTRKGKYLTHPTQSLWTSNVLQDIIKLIKMKQQKRCVMLP